MKSYHINKDLPDAACLNIHVKLQHDTGNLQKSYRVHKVPDTARPGSDNTLQPKRLRGKKKKKMKPIPPSSFRNLFYTYSSIHTFVEKQTLYKYMSPHIMHTLL